MAQYLTHKDLKGINVSDIMTERDITFRSTLEKKKVEGRSGIDLLMVCLGLVLLCESADH